MRTGDSWLRWDRRSIVRREPRFSSRWITVRKRCVLAIRPVLLVAMRCDFFSPLPPPPLLGVSPDKIIYANPCKERAQIEFAKANGITMYTLDNRDELLKLHSIHKDAKLGLPRAQKSKIVRFGRCKHARVCFLL